MAVLVKAAIGSVTTRSCVALGERNRHVQKKGMRGVVWWLMRGAGFVLAGHCAQKPPTPPPGASRHSDGVVTDIDDNGAQVLPTVWYKDIFGR